MLLPKLSLLKFYLIGTIVALIKISPKCRMKAQSWREICTLITVVCNKESEKR